MPSSSSIIGHSKQREAILQDLAKNNVSHAYLFAGDKDLGKFTIAKWFAKKLLTDKTDTSVLDAEHLIDKNMHPDLITLDKLWMEDKCTDWKTISMSSNVTQEHRAKAKAKTNVIGIDDIRSIQERLHETSQTGRTCCLMRSIERMHNTAANSFLKILEEPPKHVVFCLTTENLNSIPDTVASRMRIIRFYPLSEEEMSPMLDTFSEEDQRFLSHIAQGRPGILFRCKEDTSLLRTLRQAHIDAEQFVETNSALDRFKKASASYKDPKSEIFMQYVFLHLQKKLKSENSTEVDNALRMLKCLFPILHTLKSNTHKDLLAVQTALQCSSKSSHI
ncbi:AAA family ATPase [Candidatus Peribacteria bacterium]|jgi:DNA polymerase III delta prime subunit|nr:AAA family ATPase [Candidatus Peribacteria bacterium]MBT4021015.1 AAA family ATPase [Candidatus Peribacteria bacterium]MBT4240914.1 AAA family ATPase [Candidatus Peribacteria bacterium]